MGTILSIYLIIAFTVIFAKLFLKLLAGIPVFALAILALPASPFIVAYNIRKEKRIQSVLIFCLWGLFYLMGLLLCFIY